MYFTIFCRGYVKYFIKDAKEKLEISLGVVFRNLALNISNHLLVNLLISNRLYLFFFFFWKTGVSGPGYAHHD